MHNIAKFHHNLIGGVQKIQLHKTWGYRNKWQGKVPAGSFKSASNCSRLSCIWCHLVVAALPPNCVAGFLGSGMDSRTFSLLVGTHLIISLFWEEWTAGYWAGCIHPLSLGLVKGLPATSLPSLSYLPRRVANHILSQFTLLRVLTHTHTYVLLFIKAVY